ncbi:MAG TPA: LemA family protein [Gammaproteobacteria bacterium]|nr:LemA family protein [Gammaproteobacteria bacterium]
MEAGTIFWAVIGLLLVVLVVYVIQIYNRLVALKHNVSKAWSNIDVLLKQRHDELPKLVEVCKQYMGYEQETLEKVMQARSRVAQAREGSDMPALGAAETQLRLGLGSLFALAEAYPDLKANTTFQHLQDRITAMENSIADRREYYNESVNLNNVRIEQFPDVIVANKFGFKPFELLEFSEEEIADVSVKNLFATG